MKKIILVALLIASINLLSQNTYTDLPGRWRIGLNAGALWQTCDVTPHANIAGGFNIEKILNKRADAWIGFSLGIRYMSGHCTGLDTKASYGVNHNTALNGSYDSTINYTKNGGYFYNNYKSYIHEGNLELKINFPRFEQRTHLIFHVFGGLGVTNFKTWINAVDANGQMYDFSSLQNMQSVSAADVRHVLTGSYGTLAQGSSPNGTTMFVPSLGIGFGFKLSKGVALVFEYKASFPNTNLLDGVNYNNNDEPVKQKDFYNYASANLLFTIFGRNNGTSNGTTYVPPTNPTTVYSNPPPVNNPVYTTPQQPVYNNQPVYNQPYYNQPPQQAPVPYVTISSPMNGFSSQGDYTSVQGNIQNIASAQQINISQNGNPIRYFSYDQYNGNIHFQTFLQQGANNIIVTAYNQSGTGSQNITVFYNPPYVQQGNYQNEYPNGGGNTQPIYNNNTTVYTNNTNPVPTQTYIPTNNYNPNNNIPTHTINGTGGLTTNTGIPSHTITETGNLNPNTGIPSHTITETGNLNTNIGIPSHTITETGNLNPNTGIPSHTIIETGNLNPNTGIPSHTIIETGNLNPNTGIPSHTITETGNLNTNTGIPTHTVTETGNLNTNNGLPHGTIQLPGQLVSRPVVQFTNPFSSPTEETNTTFPVSASIQNITSANQLVVTLNGSNFSQFNFNPSNQTLSFNASLLTGFNSISIIATNSAGTDTKSTVIDYKPEGKPPRIEVFNPSTSPFTIQQNHIIINGYVYNVISSSDISVTVNGQVSSFNYNVNTHEIDIPANLQTNDNNITITASNLSGKDIKQVVVTYQVPVVTQTNGLGYGVHTKPQITVTSPSSSPYTSMSGVISVAANINYVINNQDVSVTYNGTPVSISYDKNSEHLNFTSPLRAGSNVFVITANNSAGSSTQSVEINYVPTNTTTTFNGYQAPRQAPVFNNNQNTQPVNNYVPPKTFNNPQPQQPINTGRPIQQNKPAAPVQQQQPTNNGRPMNRPR